VFPVFETARYPTKSLVTRQAAKDTRIGLRLSRDPHAIAWGLSFPLPSRRLPYAHARAMQITEASR
jgi:hypothetical protein